MGGEHREKTDQVLAAGADEDALRAILAAAAEPDRFRVGIRAKMIGCDFLEREPTIIEPIKHYYE
eukprot:COSAG05_NODE_1724_length_4196_cov_33.086152_1_plen_65_part_00